MRFMLSPLSIISSGAVISITRFLFEGEIYTFTRLFEWVAVMKPHHLPPYNCSHLNPVNTARVSVRLRYFEKQVRNYSEITNLVAELEHHS